MQSKGLEGCLLLSPAIGLGKDSLDTSFGILFDSPILHTPLKNLGSSTSTPHNSQVLPNTSNKSPNILNTPEFSLDKLPDNSKNSSHFNMPITIKANKNLKHGFDDFVLPKSINQSINNQFASTKNVFNSTTIKILNPEKPNQVSSVKYFCDDANSTRINLADCFKRNNADGFTKISLKSLKPENITSVRNALQLQNGALKDSSNIRNVDDNGNSTINNTEIAVFSKLNSGDNSNDLTESLHDNTNFFWLDY